MSIDSHRDHTEKKAKTVISEYEGPLLRYAMQILGDDNLAQDAVKEAFVRLPDAWRKKGADFSCDELSAVLFRAVHNAVIGIIRKKRKQSRKTKVFHVPGDPAESAIEVVRELDLKEQQIVILKIFERKNNLEISRITEMNEETVVMLLYKSVIKIATKLKKAGLL